MAGVLSTSHATFKLGDMDTVHSGGCVCGGLYFGLQCSQGRALLIHALGLAGWALATGDAEVCLYVCVEGDGAGREQQREAWREVARGTIKRCTVTRLALSSPVAVGDGATVGFYVRATNGGLVLRCDKLGALGTVDASDGVLSVLRGGRQGDSGLFGECFAYPHNCAAFVGLVEYTLTIAESVPPEPAPAPAPAMTAEAAREQALAQAASQEKARADAAVAQAAELEKALAQAAAREQALTQAVSQEKARADAAVVRRRRGKGASDTSPPSRWSGASPADAEARMWLSSERRSAVRRGDTVSAC